jgi:hypothetical protein
MNLLNDIYYSKEYASLYLKENEEIFEFKYEENEKIFYNLAIKRPILRIGSQVIKDNYFDLETAYGYGGYYTNSDDFSFLKEAFKAYEEKCKKEGIIAEFIRFHPFNDFPKKYGNLLDMAVYDRDIIYIDLTFLSKKERWKSYSSKTRNILRRCERELIFKESKNLETFLKLYKETMDKNNADKFYYFDKNYFENLLNNEKVKLYEVKKDNDTISMGFFMFSDEFVHYHLSANNYRMKKYNGNYFLLDNLFEIGQKQNKKYFILGGGTTGDENDSLFKFKKKFSPLTKPFYIGGKIFNKEIYSKYVNLWEKEAKKDVKYFLKYRLEV